MPRLTIQEELPSEGALSNVEEEQELLDKEQGAMLRAWEHRKTREKNLVDLCKRGSQTKRGEDSCWEPPVEGGE